MLEIINKDLLSVKEGIICQQVNCQGVMGAGLALTIRNKYPIVYEEYKRFCDSFQIKKDLLGQVLNVQITDRLIVSNLFGQFYYGRDKRYTDYDAFESCLDYLENTVDYDTNIYFPYKIGCNLAGGDWNIISKLIDEYLPDAIICKLENI